MNVGRIVIRIGMVMALIGCIYLFLRIPAELPGGTQRSINVLVWPNVIDASHCIEFEKRTGIKVYLTYFESYESLLVKMKSSGSADYDLVMAPDYFVKLLARDGSIKKFDRSKLTIWNKIHSSLVGLPYDPRNEYTVPFSWEVYGLGVDMSYFKDVQPDSTWGILFDQHKAPHRVGMLDGAREVVSIASLYLFGPTPGITDEQLAQIKQLLVVQKEWVVMYSDLRSDYMLASKAAPVVLAISSEIYQAMRYNNNIKFLLPREGSFMMVDSFVFPAQSTKQDLVYEFLNYLYNPELIREYVARYNFFPVVKNVHTDEHLFLAPTRPLLSRLRFFTAQTHEQRLRQLWIELKS